MFRKLLLFLILLLPACELDGINGADDYVGNQLVHSRVVDVTCPDSVLVGVSFECLAFNTFNATVEDARWSSSSQLLVQIGNLSGDATAIAVGTAVITGMGWRSQAADTVVVH